MAMADVSGATTRHSRRRWLMMAAGLSVLGGASLWGCSGDQPHYRVIPGWDPQQLPRAPGLALVLGSGGPRGFAHLGVLRALVEAGVRPDLLVGTSVGALIAVLFSAGMAPEHLQNLASRAQIASWVRPHLGGPPRISNIGLAGWVQDQVDGRLLQELPIPVVVTATRLDGNLAVAFNTGDAGAAVCASAAVPGVFAPVRLGRFHYQDGDVVSPVAMKLARELGARKVLAVDVSAHLDGPLPEGSQRYREQDLERAAKIEAERRYADHLIHPDIGYWAPFGEASRHRAIEEGYQCARRWLAEPAHQQWLRQV